MVNVFGRGFESRQLHLRGFLQKNSLFFSTKSSCFFLIINSLWASWECVPGCYKFPISYWYWCICY